MVIYAIHVLDTDLDNRKQVLAGVADGGGHASVVVPPFTFDENGNIGPRDKYNVYGFKNGRTVYQRTLYPPHVLH
jgi:hypothetical protein